jgi:hypothetical protein
LDGRPDSLDYWGRFYTVDHYWQLTSLAHCANSRRPRACSEAFRAWRSRAARFHSTVYLKDLRHFFKTHNHHSPDFSISFSRVVKHGSLLSRDHAKVREAKGRNQNHHRNQPGKVFDHERDSALTWLLCSRTGRRFISHGCASTSRLSTSGPYFLGISIERSSAAGAFRRSHGSGEPQASTSRSL